VLRGQRCTLVTWTPCVPLNALRAGGWPSQQTQLAKAVEIKAEDHRTKIGKVITAAKEMESVIKSKIVSKHITVMDKSAKLVEEVRVKKSARLAAFREEEAKKMEQARVRQMEREELRRQKVEEEFAQRQARTATWKQREAEKREMFLVARLRKEEAVKQKVEQLREQEKETRQQKHSVFMAKLETTVAKRQETIASRTLKAKEHAMAKRNEVLQKISLAAETQQAKVGSWASKDVERTRKLLQRKAAESELHAATIERAKATVIERNALETRAFLAASGHIRVIPGMEMKSSPAAGAAKPTSSSGEPMAAAEETAAEETAAEETAAEETAAEETAAEETAAEETAAEETAAEETAAEETAAEETAAEETAAEETAAA
jgi:hypothetical protein